MKLTTRNTLLITIGIILSLAVIGSVAHLLTNSLPKSQPGQSEPESTISIPGNQPPYNFDYSWTEHPYIAHAMGGILGDTYTNSYEAFLLNYQLGQRVFEVDFVLTEDGDTVAEHDGTSWQDHTSGTENVAFTHDNFMSYLAYDKYHRLDAQDVLEIMQKYPDIYIVTDSKYYDESRVTAQFTRFVELAKKIDPAVLDRIIIQIYRPEMLSTVMQIYPWKSIIYTLYLNAENWTPENVLAFSQESGVKFITMWDTWVKPEILTLWDTNGIKVAAHTVNNLATANQLRALGVDVIYTDFLIP